MKKKCGYERKILLGFRGGIYKYHRRVEIFGSDDPPIGIDRQAFMEPEDDRTRSTIAEKGGSSIRWAAATRVYVSKAIFADIFMDAWVGPDVLQTSLDLSEANYIERGCKEPSSVTGSSKVPKGVDVEAANMEPTSRVEQKVAGVTGGVHMGALGERITLVKVGDVKYRKVGGGSRLLRFATSSSLGSHDFDQQVSNHHLFSKADNKRTFLGNGPGRGSGSFGLRRRHTGRG
jgi:hypothetical protein